MPALVWGWVNFPILWPHPRTNEIEVPPPRDPVWCEQLHSKPIRYGLVSLSIVHIVSDRFPNRPKNRSVWTWHELSIILSNEARLHGAIYRGEFFLYWCYVIGYNVTMPGIQEALTCISWYVIRVKYPWIERHLNPWQNQVQRCKKIGMKPENLPHKCIVFD